MTKTNHGSALAFRRAWICMGLGWVQVLMILDPFVRWWWLHIINLVAAVFAFWAALKVRKCAMRIREIEQEIEKAKKLIRNHENQ